MSEVTDNPFLAGLELPGVDPRTERLAHARDVKREKIESKRKSLIQRAREAKLDDEKRRIADYCIKQIEGPRQDVSHLRGRLEEIMKDYERRRR